MNNSLDDYNNDKGHGTNLDAGIDIFHEEDALWRNKATYATKTERDLYSIPMEKKERKEGKSRGEEGDT